MLAKHEALARIERLDTYAVSDSLDQPGLAVTVSGTTPQTVRTRIFGRSPSRAGSANYDGIDDLCDLTQ